MKGVCPKCKWTLTEFSARSTCFIKRWLCCSKCGQCYDTIYDEHRPINQSSQNNKKIKRKNKKYDIITYLIQEF